MNISSNLIGLGEKSNKYQRLNANLRPAETSSASSTESTSTTTQTTTGTTTSTTTPQDDTAQRVSVHFLEHLFQHYSHDGGDTLTRQEMAHAALDMYATGHNRTFMILATLLLGGLNGAGFGDIFTIDQFREMARTSGDPNFLSPQDIKAYPPFKNLLGEGQPISLAALQDIAYPSQASGLPPEGLTGFPTVPGLASGNTTLSMQQLWQQFLKLFSQQSASGA